MIQDQQYYEIEQPDELSARNKDDAMGAYLMMFGSMAVGLPLPLLNLLASIIYYFGYKNKSRFVKFHCLQSLYSQLPTSILNGVFVIWTIRMIFFRGFDEDGLINGFASAGDLYWGFLYTLIILNLLYIIFSIVAAIRAKNGRMYYFIFFGKLSYHQVYKIRPNDRVNEDNENKVELNKPPV